MRIPEPHSNPQSLTALYAQWAQPEYMVPEPRLRRAVAKLERERRRALILVMKGFSYRQIARTLGITPHAVQERVKRALVAARKDIEDLPRYHVTGRRKKAGGPDSASSQTTEETQ